MEKKEISGIRYTLQCAPATLTKLEHVDALDARNEEEGGNRVRISFVYCDEESTITDERIDMDIQAILQAAQQAPYTFVLDTTLLKGIEDGETWIKENVIAKRAKVLCSTIKVDIAELAKNSIYAKDFEGVVRVKNENTENVFSSMSRSYLGNSVDEENAVNKILSQFVERVDLGELTPVRPTEEKPQQQHPQNNLRRR